MTKKTLYAMAIICLSIPFILSVTACDLSHKHYLDNYGYCRSCDQDMCIALTKNSNSEYIAEINIDPYNETFLSFVSDGEQGIEITVSNYGSGVVNSIILYSQDDDYIVSKYDTSNPVLTYSDRLTKNKKYYIKIKFTQVSQAKITIKSLV